MRIVLRAIDAITWFLFRRPLPPVEIAIIGWFLLAAGYVFLAAHRFDIPSDRFKPPLALTLTACGTVVMSVGRMLWQRQWKAVALFAALSVLSMPFAGMLQMDRCPHARYVQLFGFSFSVDGERCGNPRRVEPWWMRE